MKVMKQINKKLFFKLTLKQVQAIVIYGIKFSISFAFLSAVSDRFGIWGNAGAQGVSWGDMSHFLSYTAILTPWSPKALIPFIGWAVTVLEIMLAALLLTPFKTKEVAFLSGVLLFIFGISMTVTIGFKAPLDYSVFSASFAAFSLAYLECLELNIYD